MPRSLPIVVLLLILHECAFGTPPNCPTRCEEEVVYEEIPGASNVTMYFCGSDGITYPIGAKFYPFAADCYFSCGIIMQYPASCGCPNDCYQSIGRGVCTESGCACSEGWTGSDCSMVLCASSNPNNCSFHGVCVTDPEADEQYCQCDPGWTSQDCSTMIPPNLPPLPYGDLFPDDRDYWVDDKYGDDHPLFNLTVIANLKFNTSEANLAYMYSRSNLFNASYIDGQLIYDNGIVRETIQGVGLKLKGDFTRFSFRRGYDIKFPNEWMGIKKMQLKGYDPSNIINLLSTDMYRAMNIPSPRSSFASLWINDIHLGVYWLSEGFDKDFLKARYQKHKGNFYKGCQEVIYINDNPSSYSNMTKDLDGFIMPIFEQVCGDGDWTDFVSLAKYGNLTVAKHNDKLSAGVDVVDVDRFARLIAADCITVNADCYESTGNNWYVYDNPQTKLFEMIAHDFDESMQQLSSDATVKSFLRLEIMQPTSTVQLFDTYLALLLDNVLGTSTIQDRISNLTALLTQEATRDTTFQLENHISFEDVESTRQLYLQSVEAVSQFVQQRFVYLKNNKR